jgi:prepilin signal peptidase PulO-like enzyme (type II secretory pathway)
MYLLFISVGIYSSIQDWRTGFVSRYVLWGATIVMIVVRVVFWNPAGSLYIWGLCVGYGVFILTWVLSKYKIGLADVWFSGFLGASFGIFMWYPAILLACLFTLSTMLLRGRKKLPFIPFMFLGGIVVCIFDMVNIIL